MKTNQDNLSTWNQDPQYETMVSARPRLTFVEAVRLGKSKLADFSGRSRRSEFWWYGLYWLCMVLAPLLVAFLLKVIQKSVSGGPSMGFKIFIGLFVIVGCVLGLLMTITMLAAQTRRLHDTGRSGWWVVASLALRALTSGTMSNRVYHFAQGMMGDTSPIAVDYWDRMMDLMHLSPALFGVGMALFVAYVAVNITIFVFCLQDSHKGPNKYGPSPKYDNDGVFLIY